MKARSGRLLGALATLAAAGALAFWLATEPRPVGPVALAAHEPDVANGRVMFFAAGCASCHAAPKAKGEEKLRLGGGLALRTPFGTFHAPNISPDPEDGIGAWRAIDFVNAVMRGLSPAGRHYYPAFPWTSYGNMRVEDVLDLWAFIRTLPPVKGRAPAHELPLPLRWRRLLGGWKLLYGVSYAPPPLPADAPPEVRRGFYLVNGPGHCGECHTPRNAIGIPDAGWFLAGAPDPEGTGTVPNITLHPEGIGEWSVEDLVAAFRTGILPDFETFGGSMIAVQENLAELPEADLRAIAIYLKTAVPPKPSRFRKRRAAVAE